MRSVVGHASALALMAVGAVLLGGCTTVQLLTRSPVEPCLEAIEEGSFERFNAVMDATGLVPDIGQSSGQYIGYRVISSTCPRSVAPVLVVDECSVPNSTMGISIVLGRTADVLTETLVPLGVHRADVFTAPVIADDNSRASVRIAEWSTGSDGEATEVFTQLTALLGDCAHTDWRAIRATGSSVIVVEAVASATGAVVESKPVTRLADVWVQWDAADAALCVTGVGFSTVESDAGTALFEAIAGLDADLTKRISASGASSIRGGGTCGTEAPVAPRTTCEVRERTMLPGTKAQDQVAFTEWLFGSGMDAVMFVDVAVRDVSGDPVYLEATAWRYSGVDPRAVSLLRELPGSCRTLPMAVVEIDDAYVVVVEQVVESADAQRILSQSAVAEIASAWGLAITPFPHIIID